MSLQHPPSSIFPFLTFLLPSAGLPPLNDDSDSNNSSSSHSEGGGAPPPSAPLFGKGKQLPKVWAYVALVCALFRVASWFPTNTCLSRAFTCHQLN